MEKSNDTQQNTQTEKLFRNCEDCQVEIEVSQERANRYTHFLCDNCKNIHREKHFTETIHRILPKKFWDIETDKPLDKYMAKSLFIHGKAGVGKTVLACSLAKEYIRQGRKVKFISYPVFIMELQGGFKRDEDVYRLAKEIVLYEGMLIIDELGGDIKLTDFVRQITYYLINEREMSMLPMIITANIDLNEIASMFDERISSRIKGCCEVLNFQGKDRR